MRRFSKTEEERLNIVSDKKLFRFAFNYLKSYKLLILLSTVFIVTSSLISLIPELLIRRIIDVNIANRDLVGLVISASFMAIVYVFSWLLGFVSSYSTAKLGQSNIYDLRKDMYNKLLNQSQSYFDEHQSGKINSKLTNDLETLANFLGNSFVSIIAAFIQLSGIIVIMLILDLNLALISFAMIPLLLLITLFFRGPVRRASRRTRKTIAKVTDNISENISGAKVTKTFAREDKNREEFERINRENYQASMMATKLFAFIFPLVGIISALGTAFILFYAGYQTAVIGTNVYTVGLVATFMAYLTRFFRPVFRISMFYSIWQSALASLERVYLFLNEDISVIDSSKSNIVKIEDGRVDFKNVNFSYTSTQNVFTDLSVTIEGEKLTALVGETGAGKSTFIKLIPRFYNIQEGEILIDGIPNDEIKLKCLRKQIGIVPQTTHLFNTSIIENLRYGSSSVTRDQVIKISKEIGLHEYVTTLPDGYDTEVSEDGKILSEGTRQLVSFARALIKNPKILILDEATSSLDPISEIRVQEALQKLMKDRTVIAIAHRLSTIRSADRILVLEQGEVIQDGSHYDLVRQEGKYQELYLKQFLLKKEGVELKVRQKQNPKN